MVLEEFVEEQVQSPIYRFMSYKLLGETYTDRKCRECGALCCYAPVEVCLESFEIDALRKGSIHWPFKVHLNRARITGDRFIRVNRKNGVLWSLKHKSNKACIFLDTKKHTCALHRKGKPMACRVWFCGFFYSRLKELQRQREITCEDNASTRKEI
jgi:Fe-S-cluster containining protein